MSDQWDKIREKNRGKPPIVAGTFRLGPGIYITVRPCDPSAESAGRDLTFSNYDNENAFECFFWPEEMEDLARFLTELARQCRDERKSPRETFVGRPTC